MEEDREGRRGVGAGEAVGGGERVICGSGHDKFRERAIHLVRYPNRRENQPGPRNGLPRRGSMSGLSSNALGGQMLNVNCFRSALFAVALALFLSACATQAQRQHQQLSDQLKVASNAISNCEDKTKYSETIQQMSQRFILYGDDPNKLAKMAVDEYATKQEKENIIAYSILAQECRSITLQEYGKVHPEFVTLFAKRFVEQDSLRLKVLRDEITVGKANEKAEQQAISMNAKWATAWQHITSQLQSAHQDEIQQRQAAAQALQAWNYQQQQLNIQRQQLYNQQLYNQQLINTMNKPIYTNCTYVGISLSCTSY